jgi:enoyl-CoA hydratase/carnithine racemase
LVAELRAAVDAERSGWVTVALDEGIAPPAPLPVARLASLPFVVVGVLRGTVDPGWFDVCDVVVEEGHPSLDLIRANLEARPIACTTLALLLRAQPRRPLDDGLVAESAAYSVLQAGPEFATWRSGRPRRIDPNPGGQRVRVDRDGDVLTVTLTRPERLNALDAAMRDELTEALVVAASDPDVARVDLRGEGRAFCAGGDLDEFGARADPASAHLVRLQRSVGRALAHLDKPVVAHVHGASFGSGIELAAFARTVVAEPDTRIALPEVGLGLIPGAGGTVSLPARIGRLRTAWLALSGETIDASTARSWGLVDRVVPGEGA